MDNCQPIRLLCFFFYFKSTNSFAFIVCISSSQLLSLLAPFLLLYLTLFIYLFFMPSSY
ncbi:hypothetical protein BDV30DRAFT_214763 [Aspergillus minisclerotigenes]|uniref:Uncharacterized protein n=1 Tax=Aspergillus minisclerotigenes TaxID=656917 RepID=A0A5N6IZH5_9EURO|nr:hypothetical protein BDV30DRAFT_214763 [Aspergillus minisclerotigenes]